MKGVLSIFLVAVLIQIALAALPQKCEDILAQQRCDDLRSAAKKLGLTVLIVDQAIREAVQKNIQNAKDIAAFVRDTIVAKAKDFKCENVLAQPICDSIRRVAERVGFQVTRVNQILKEAIADGVSGAKDLFEAVKNKILETVGDEESLLDEEYAYIALPTKCEDVLSAEVCADLRNIAKRLGQAAQSVDDAVRAAVEKKIQKTKEIIQFVRDSIVAAAKNFKCENVLAQPVCARIRETAKAIGVEAARVNQIVKEAVAQGITRVQDILDFVKNKIINVIGDEPQNGE